MPLVNPREFIEAARDQGAAIAAFNVHNLETIQAVVEVAAQERAPVILQTTPGTLTHAGIAYIAAVAKTAAEASGIPIALHLDHCRDYKTVVQCIRHGYTSVMIDGSGLSYQENVQLTRDVVKVAHAAGVAVEAELGRIVGTEDEISVEDQDGFLTVPEEAQQFVLETNVDLLAVAIGTAHGMYKGEPKLDFQRLSAIRELVAVPLVLHGGSGVPNDSVQEAIRRGICKVNIATELKIPMAQAIQRCFVDNPNENDPRKYMGAAKDAVKRVVQEKIRLCMASGLADQFEDR